MKSILSVKTLLCGAAIAGIAACSPISLKSDTPPAMTYMLNAAPAAPASGRELDSDIVLVVGEPMMAAGMDRDQIALLLDGGRRLDYYAHARWPARLPQLMQDVIVKSARNAYGNIIVDSRRARLSGTHQLNIDVIKFAPLYQGDATGAPVLEAEVRFVLIELTERKVVADFTARANNPAPANTLTGVTGGMEKLLQQILADSLPRIAQSLPAQGTLAPRPAAPRDSGGSAGDLGSLGGSFGESSVEAGSSIPASGQPAPM